MNELTQRVADKVGINQDQAQKAVETVIAFLKEKLPASMSGQLDNLVATGGSTAGAAKALGSKLGL